MTTPLFEGMNLANPRLSTDGSQVAFEQASAGIAAPDIWVRHLARGVDRRLTVSAANDIGPIWTPDDTSVTFGSDRDDPDTLNLYQRPVDLSAPAERVLDVTVHEDEQASPPEERDLNLGSWAPDGTLVYYHRHAAGDRDIWSLPPGGTPEVFLATTSSESAPRVSPNGRWLVYVSDQTGEYRVYVQAFPAGGAVHPISPGLGTEPVWSRDGRELFYRSGQQMTAVGVDTGPTFAAHGNELLFQWPYNPPRGGSVPNYDVSLDGQQFLMVQPTGAAGTAELTIVLDWFEDLTRLVPTP
jgi:Tol biopolymer transport system component